MKSERRSITRSAPVFDRRPKLGPRTLRDAKDMASARSVAKTALARSSQAMDLERLLHFSQELYAHALTLQAVLRTGGELDYETLRPRYDQQAAQQFEIFHRTFQRPSEFRKRNADARNKKGTLKKLRMPG